MDQRSSNYDFKDDISETELEHTYPVCQKLILILHFISFHPSA